MEKMKMQTKDMIQENIETIKGLFPEVVTEGKDSEGKAREVIDFDRLKEILGDDISSSAEHYEFTWVGKREARRLAATPINKTLRPCKEESKDWDSTENLYIEGDNLDVLKLLQESYLGKVKMIYIDPPYNTGKDFVYRDNFHQSQESWKEQTTLVDEENNRLAVNPDSSGRFHSDWCTMMYPRLRLAKNLLRDDGVVFISIDDNEVASLKQICDEIFCESNFVGCAGRITKKSNNKGDYWAPNFDYILTYVKNINIANGGFFGGVNLSSYNLIEQEGSRKGENYQLVRLYMSTIKNRNPDQRFWIECPDGSHIIPPGSTFPPERPNLGDGIWRWTKKTFLERQDRIVIKQVRSSNLLNKDMESSNWNVFTKTYLNDVIDKSSAKPNSFIEGFINQLASHELKALSIPFDYAKPSSLVKYLLEISKCGPSDIVLDFFSGSATTAHAVMQLNADDGGNRKFIMVQVPEKCDEKSEAFKDGYSTICEIGKERIRRAGEKIRKAVEEENTQLDLGGEPKKIPDIGFRVLKIDSSNMNDVYYGAAELEQKDLFDSESNIKADRTELDILFGIMIDWGLPLSLPYKKEMIGDTAIHNVEDGALIACFADSISEEVVIAIAKRQATKVVFKDNCFSSSVDRINVEQLFKHYDPTFVSSADKIRVL